MLSFEQCFNLFSSFPLLLAFFVGGLGFEFCVFVAGWRHALRSEWPFIIIIINTLFAFVLEFVCLPWSEVCSARVTSLLLFLIIVMNE